MWDEEDNSPYAGAGNYNQQQDSPTSPPTYNANETPDFVSKPADLSDDEEAEYKQQQSGQLPRKGGYDSRIQQLLYENPELEVIIVSAGKAPHGSFIEYRIRTGDVEVARRYSEFASLRNALVSLNPTLIIPPIPEKHTISDYAAAPTKAKEDANTIDQRKRMLSSFLNRCRRMKEILDSSVYWRFLDPNSSWNEVLHAHPISSVPKNNLKAPPLDPANPTPAHQWLPVPSQSAKLKTSGTASSSGTPVSPPDQVYASTAAHTTPGPQIFGRFPPNVDRLSETDLDPYFVNFEAGTRELEILLQGNIDKVNRRTIEHLTKLSSDLAELGARYNGFSLSEQSPTVAAAIERVGQAVDSTYISTEELALNFGANFSEPMRESAQFAGVVRNVLRYRVLKRVQQEMTRDELEKKKTTLDQLERSELEAKRIDQYLASSTTLGGTPSRSTSNASQKKGQQRREGSDETESVDSDFPPQSQGEDSASPAAADQGQPDNVASPHKKQSRNSITNKVFGSFRHAVNGFVDVDPERTRRDQMGKTKESLTHLEQALEVSEKDVKDATQGVIKDLKRFQTEKEEDLQKYMVCCVDDFCSARLTFYRLPMHAVILIGLRRTWGHGVRRRKRSKRLWLGNGQCRRCRSFLMPG